MGKEAAKKICDFVLQRPMAYQSFIDIDVALDKLSYYEFTLDLHSTTWGDTHTNKKKPNMLAKYLANFLSENNIVFNDANSTPYEMEEIEKTVIGDALFKFKCFASQRQTKAKTTATKQNAKQGASQSGTPNNTYKSSGGQSGNIINIVGQPGVKVYAQNNVAICIIADKTGKNTPNAYVKPLDQKYNQNGVAQVCFGSGNGYTDCKCWFDDLTTAQAFLSQVQAKFGNNFTNIRLAKTNPDKNGYFLVKTEFGECAIKASKLNEGLGEELQEDKDKSNRCSLKSKSYEIEDIETYHEAFMRYE